MIENLIEKIEQLPPIPNVINQLQDLYFYDDYNTSDIEAVIEQDPNLVANILKIANSPYYGLPREFLHIRQAVAYFGLEQLIEFAMATVVDQLLKLDLSFYGIGAEEFMKMARAKAKLAKSLAQDKADRFIASSTAFLSDISKVLISNYALEQGLSPIDPSIALNEMDEVERDLLGFDTIEVSLKMFDYWQFDRAIVELLDSFKQKDTPRKEALFFARELLDAKGEMVPEKLQTYPQFEPILKSLR